MATLTAPSVPRLADIRRLVVKIGSALLVDGASGALRADWLRAMAEDVAMLGKKQHVQRDGGISAVPWKKTVQRQTVDLHL